MSMNFSEKDTEKKLKELKTEPSAEWQERAKFIISEYANNHPGELKPANVKGFSIFDIFGLAISIKRPLMFVLIIFIFFALSFGGGITLISFLTPEKISETKNIKLSQDEKQKIFENIAKSNPENIIQKVSENSGGNLSSIPALPELQIQKETFEQAPVATSTKVATEKIDYIKTKSTIQLGGAVAECPRVADSFVASTVNYVVEESFDKTTNTYLKKSVTSVGNGEVVNYILSTQKGDDIEAYIYNGGEYIVRQNFGTDIELNEPQTPISYPVSYTETDSGVALEKKVEVDVVGEEIINGRKFYLVEYITDLNCSDNSSSEKIILRDLVDQETFAVVESNVYISEVKDDNLLFSKKIEIIQEEKNPSELNLIFSPDPSIRTVFYPKGVNFFTESEEDAIASSILSTLKITPFALSTNDSRSITLKFEIKEFIKQYKFLADSGFYSNTELGEKMWLNFLTNSFSKKQYPLIAKFDYFEQNRKIGEIYFRKDEFSSEDLSTLLGGGNIVEAESKLNFEGNEVDSKLFKTDASEAYIIKFNDSKNIYYLKIDSEEILNPSGIILKYLQEIQEVKAT